jgi:hypothetical protein
MYNKRPANKMNKQTDTEKEKDKVTDNKDDRKIHRKVCICDNKNNNTCYSPTTIISTKIPANGLPKNLHKDTDRHKKDKDTDTNTNTNTDKGKTQRQRKNKTQKKT